MERRVTASLSGRRALACCPAPWCRRVTSVRSVAVCVLAVLGTARAGLPQENQQNLVRDVTGRLEVALRADRSATVDWTTVRLCYLIARAGATATNASVEVRASRADQAPRSDNLIACWDLHPLAGEGTWAQTTGADRYDATVTLGQRLLSDVCRHEPSRVAIIVGHELGHLARWDFGAPASGAGDRLALADLTQEKELAADQVGLHLALAAGYADAVTAASGVWEDMSRILGDQCPLEPAAAFSTHPSHRLRIELLQRSAATKLAYRAQTTFDVGVHYLQMGYWLEAQGCFEAAADRFPNCPEILTNIGYAYMMRYYSTLPTEARGRLGGEVSCLSFVASRPPIRGGPTLDRSLLEEATRRYRAALAADSGFSAARVNLGTALLMDPGSGQGSDTLVEAIDLLDAAASQAQTAGSEAVLVDALTNRALALRRLGRLDADQYCQELAAAYQRVGQSTNCLALKLNLARALVERRRELPRARSLLLEYLSATYPGSWYHKEARKCLQDAAAASGEPLPKVEEPVCTWSGGWSVAVGDCQIGLATEWEQVRKALQGQSCAVIPLGDIPQTLTCDAPNLGLQLRVWHGRLKAILLLSSAAPEVTIWHADDRQKEGPHLTLRVGAKAPRLEAEGETRDTDRRELGPVPEPLKISGLTYDLYRSSNVAIRWSGNPPVIGGIALISQGE